MPSGGSRRSPATARRSTSPAARGACSAAAGAPWTTEAEFEATTRYFQPPAEAERFNVIRHERSDDSPGATMGQVAASTQNQALSALLFLYREVLGVEMPRVDNIVRARRSTRLPVVLTREEVRAIIRQLRGVPRLMAILLYGAGLRLWSAPAGVQSPGDRMDL